ncbi:YceI family protein, partial [Fulvivirga sp. RKSG066]|uniref:YceI family protein n=1 Tax=Fulvivirga aurantia TaxID=2529383 RepID=UPI0012BB5837
DAEVSEAKEVEEVNASSEYSISKEDSKISWIGSKPTGKHNGSIPIAQGQISTKDGEIVGGTITLDIANIKNEDLADKPDMQSDLVKHLKSADFFHADSFPTGEFVITSVKTYSEEDKPEAKEQYETEYTPATADEFMVESPTHKITGNLTMRGKTLSVAFPASVKMEDGKIMAMAKFNIDRTNWGLMYGDEADAIDKAKDKF